MEQGVQSPATKETRGLGLSNPGTSRPSVGDRPQHVKGRKRRKAPRDEPKISEGVRNEGLENRDVQLKMPIPDPG
jgi:hypothetical protein